MLRIVVSGALGRMGTRLIELIKTEKDLECVGGIDKKHGIFNQVEVYDSGDKPVPLSDVVIDFSSPNQVERILKDCLSSLKPLVIGTTGLTPEILEQIKQVSKEIPVIVSPNMSLGVNLLFNLTKTATQVLKDNFDIEIVEMHHNKKKDSPSGTAMKLGKIIAGVKDQELDDIMLNGRSGKVGERSKDELGIFGVRGGSVAGEHFVMYFGEYERIELVHRASSRDTFALGALRAARFIVNQSPGLYTMADVLGFNYPD